MSLRFCGWQVAKTPVSEARFFGLPVGAGQNGGIPLLA